jgi:hypothetical protein
MYHFYFILPRLALLLSCCDGINNFIKLLEGSGRLQYIWIGLSKNLGVTAKHNLCSVFASHIDVLQNLQYD